MAEKKDRILIHGAHVTDPVTDTDQVRDILIEGEVIRDVGRIPSAEGARVLDAAGLTAIPGLMDAHVHFRDPGQTQKEDIFTGAAAAAHGGVTTVVCMANTKPPVDNIETLRYCQQKGRQTGIRLLQCAAVTVGLQGRELTDMESLAREGAAGFTDDGMPLMNEALLMQAMQRAKMLDRPVSLHEEAPAFVYAPGVNRGRVSELLGYGGADALAEDILVARDCMLALHTGASVCVQHISSRTSVELIRTARKMGADIHAEATPHHFTLTEEDVLRYGTNARMNPPLRTSRDRDAVIEGICDGTIDLIVTDHAPHTREEKAKPLPEAPSGITGLETSLGLGLKELVLTGRLSLMELIRRMSSNPAGLYRQTPASIRPGGAADLVLFDPEEYWTVDHFCSRASNSPFIGWKLPGRIRFTICAGNIIYHAQR